jgi:hypothetical protein
MRRWVIAVALVACKQDKPAPVDKPVVVPVAADAAPPHALATCDNVELELASKILSDPQHPCRDWVDATHGRMAATGMAFSGAVLTQETPRGAGWLATCQHCTGPDGDGLHDVEKEDPSWFQMRAPAKLVGTQVLSGRETQLYFVHRLFSLMPPKSAFDAKGHLTNVLPSHDFVIGVISGTPVEVVGHIGVMPSSKIGDAKLDLYDPKHIASPAEPVAGKHALVMGFPRDLPDHTFGGELVVSVGEILDDERAKSMLLKSDPDEAAIPYDPKVEVVIAARAVSGMSGGGAFDEDGHYLGIAVRGTVKPVDGKYLVRVVRMKYVTQQFQAALDRAPEPLGKKLAPFLPTK